MGVPAPPKLAFSDFCHRGHACHLARVTYRPGERFADHDHDFAEIFWITAGEGTHLTPLGQDPILPGAAGIIDAGDVHGIRTAWRAPMVLYNVAFGSEHLREIADRYDLHDALTRRGYGARPIRYPGVPAVRSLVSEYGRIEKGPRSEIAVHAFLVRCLALLADECGEAGRETSGPVWLQSAVDALRATPVELAAGVAALARLSGRHPDHVNRTCRRSLGLTASEVVNELRLDHAEDLLRASDAAVTRIAEECGFSNLSYFFRRFRQRTGTTPGRFRERHQRPVRNRP